MEVIAPTLLHPQKYQPRPLELIPGDQPAAGASFAKTNPGRQGWRLIAVVFRLVTDANVADRAVTVDYEDGNGTRFVRNGLGAVVQASTTEDFCFAANIGQAAWNTAGQAFVPLLPVELAPGQTLQITVGSVQATDQLSRIMLTFEREPYAAS